MWKIIRRKGKIKTKLGMMISVCDFKNVLLEYINYSYEETVWLLYLLFFCGGCEENENACDLLRRGEERREYNNKYSSVTKLSSSSERVK